MKEQTQIIIAIASCKKFSNRRKVMLESWLDTYESSERKIIPFVGSDSDATDVGVISLDCGDDYQDLPLKTLELIRHCVAHYDFSYLIKVDDDVYVRDFERLTKYLFDYDYIGKPVMVKDTLYGKTGWGRWHYQHVPPHLHVQVPAHLIPSIYMGGPIYALSYKAARTLSAIENSKIEELSLPCAYEDAMVGRLLEEYGSKLALNKVSNFMIRRKKSSPQDDLEELSRTYLSVSDLSIDDLRYLSLKKTHKGSQKIDATA